MRVDMLTLYAFSDKTHAKQRELWRGFLALVMPVLLECEAGEFERLLEAAQCRSIEELMSALELPQTPSELVWVISGQFSDALGFEAELGLSAFLDVNLPTRVHTVPRGHTANKEDAVVGLWLKAFRDVQQRPEFLEITQEWRRAFESLLEEEDEDAQETVSEAGIGTSEADSHADAADSPTAAESAGSSSSQRVERRSRKRGKLA
ncbi:MAG: hypothetical protein RIR26_451 [Pseudomonadota bacterium]